MQLGKARAGAKEQQEQETQAKEMREEKTQYPDTQNK